MNIKEIVKRYTLFIISLFFFGTRSCGDEAQQTWRIADFVGCQCDELQICFGFFGNMACDLELCFDSWADNNS